jgi:acetyl-CoA carboxylase carboxyl transferase subunit alpha
MARKSYPTQFAYDFERPVVELDQQIKELKERTSSSPLEGAHQMMDLETRRDELLKAIVAGLTPYQRVKLARHPLRPQSRDYISMVFKDFLELHGDRRFGDDKAIITALARLGKHRLMLIAQQKGKDTKDKMKHNFGMPNPEGYRKALAKMNLAEKFSLPVVCLIDTPGAAPAIDAEARGQAMAIAENIFRMSGLRTPIVILITGEGCSGGALGMGVGDRFAMLENAYYSVISPEGCAAILWRNTEMAEQAAQAMKLTAQDLLNLGIIDEIVKEPLGGAHRNPAEAAAYLEAFLDRTLEELSQVPMDRLLEERYQRYRRLGAYTTVSAPAEQPGASEEDKAAPPSA